jgi:hypothetical protein
MGGLKGLDMNGRINSTDRIVRYVKVVSFCNGSRGAECRITACT